MFITLIIIHYLLFFLGWMLRFQGYKNYVAYDDIKFVDCALPKKNGGVCNRRQVSCDNGACIYPEQV